MVESQVEDPVPNGQNHVAAPASPADEAPAANGVEEKFGGGRGRREHRSVCSSCSGYIREQPSLCF